jgi:hypothetical protein
VKDKSILWLRDIMIIIEELRASRMETLNRLREKFGTTKIFNRDNYLESPKQNSILRIGDR